MRIYFDVTLTHQWNRPPVGLVRTEIEIAKALLRKKTAVFLRIEPGTHRPIKVSREFLKERIKRIEAGGSEARSIDRVRPKLEKSRRTHILQMARQLSPKLRFASLLILFPLNTLLVVLKDLFSLTKNRFGELLGLLVAEKALLSGGNSKGNARFAAGPQTFVERYGLSHRCDDEGCAWQMIGKGDVFFSVGNNWDYLPMRHLNKEKISHNFGFVGICYDLVPIVHPEVAPTGYKAKFEEHYTDMLWTADQVVSISRSSENDLIAFAEERKIVSGVKFGIVTLGCDLPQLPDPADVPETLRNRKFILYVSTIEKRKNHETLFNAYGELCLDLGSDAPLMVFVGMPGWHVDDFLRLASLDPRVHDEQGLSKVLFLDSINEAGLSWLYSHALFSVYPSVYEGWGLPISESLAHGTPVLTSKGSSFSEASGGLGIEIHPFDTFGWKNQMLRLVSGGEELELLKNPTADYSPKPWDDFTEEIIGIVEHHGERL